MRLFSLQSSEKAHVSRLPVFMYWDLYGSCRVPKRLDAISAADVERCVTDKARAGGAFGGFRFGPQVLSSPI